MNEQKEDQQPTYEELQSEVYMLSETIRGLEQRCGQQASQLSRAEAGTRVLHAKNNGLQKRLDESQTKLATIESMLTEEQQKEIDQEEEEA